APSAAGLVTPPEEPAPDGLPAPSDGGVVTGGGESTGGAGGGVTLPAPGSTSTGGIRSGGEDSLPPAEPPVPLPEVAEFPDAPSVCDEWCVTVEVRRPVRTLPESSVTPEPSSVAVSVVVSAGVKRAGAANGASPSACATIPAPDVAARAPD